jgi:adenosine kinase
VIYSEGGRVDVPPVMPSSVVDPTGCGDAYRAGLLYGLMNMLDWETTGHIASLMGSMCVASRGTQNHKFNRAQFDARYEVAFGTKLETA